MAIAFVGASNQVSAVDPGYTSITVSTPGLAAACETPPTGPAMIGQVFSAAGW